MHGVPQLASTSSLARRVAYVIVVLSSLAFLVFHLSASVIEFRRFDSYVNTQTELRDDVIMPSVTICSYALHTRSAFARHFPNISQDLFVDTFTFPVLFMDNQLYEAVSEYEDQSFEEYREAPVRDLMQELRPKLEDIFIYCALHLTIINCSDYITSFHTDYGLCHIVHSLQYTRKHHLLRSSAPDQKSGFRFLLDANPDDYLYTQQYGVGFLVHVADVEQYPQTDAESLHVGVGQSVNVAFRKEIHKVLRHPYSTQDCAESQQEGEYDSRLANDYPYSKKACKYQCIEVVFYELYGCRYNFGPDSGWCTSEQLSEALLSEQYRSEFNSCTTNCKRRCEFVKYASTVTTATFPNPLTVEFANKSGFPVKTEEEMRRRMLELNIYPQTLEHTIVTQQPRYHPFDIFSNIGGLMGLCLGISIITVVEVFDFLCSCVAVLTNRKAMGTKVHSLKN